MEWEELIKIDFEPFSDEMMEDFYSSSMSSGFDFKCIIKLLLIHRYFLRFNEIYGTDIHLLDQERYFIPEFKREICELTVFQDLYAIYEANSSDTFFMMAKYAGFELFEINGIEDWEYSNDMHVKLKKRYYKECIGKIERSWRSIIWKHIGVIEELHSSMDSSDLYIMRNYEIKMYQSICKQYPDIIKTRLKKEKDILDMLIENLLKPLFYEHIRITDKIGNYLVLSFDLGNNGYEYLGFSSLNFHWIISCFMYRHLMNEFKRKFSLLIEIYPELRGAK